MTHALVTTNRRSHSSKPESFTINAIQEIVKIITERQVDQKSLSAKMLENFPNERFFI